MLTLRAWLDNPKKEIDFLKIVKVGEWLGALSDGECDLVEIERLTSIVLPSQQRSGGWNWNLKNSKEATLLPTLYALDGLVRANRRFGSYRDQIQAAIEYSIKEVGKSFASGNNYEQVYAWKACLYKVCEIVSIYESVNGVSSDYRNQLEKLLSADADLLPPDLREFKRFEYRIKTREAEEHAYCVLPVGLMQVGAECNPPRFRTAHK